VPRPPGDGDAHDRRRPHRRSSTASAASQPLDSVCASDARLVAAVSSPTISMCMTKLYSFVRKLRGLEGEAWGVTVLLLRCFCCCFFAWW